MFHEHIRNLMNIIQLQLNVPIFILATNPDLQNKNKTLLFLFEILTKEQLLCRKNKIYDFA